MIYKELSLNEIQLKSNRLIRMKWGVRIFLPSQKEFNNVRKVYTIIIAHIESGDGEFILRERNPKQSIKKVEYSASFHFSAGLCSCPILIISKLEANS